MMGEFKQEFRDGFIEASLHLVNRDYDALAKDFVTLGYYGYLSFQLPINMLLLYVSCFHVDIDSLLPPTADKDAVTKALTGFCFCTCIY